MRRQWVSALAALTFASILAGCGGGSTANVRNQPPPTVNKISIAFQPAPVNAVQLGTPVNLTAVVSNDSSNAGVDWSVVCQGANCGSFTALHTPSGQANTYTPPSNFAGNTFSVTLEAFATADHTENASASLAISGFGGTFQGTYILQAQGLDSSFSQPYQFAGAVVLDGNGGITAGEATLDVVDPNIGFLVTKSVTVTGGSYFLGADGRGTLTINTSDPSVGSNGTETFSIVYLSGSQALIAQSDFTATASGTMDLQAPSLVAPSGGYAFAVSGIDVANQIPTAFGGVFNVSAPGKIASAGSVSDQNLAGALKQNSSLSGTILGPDPFGAVTINLSIGFASGVPVQFIGYMVDATHMKLVESDNSAGTGFGSTGGLAIAQGAATGTFTAKSLSGSYVFGILGEDLSLFQPATLTSVGVFNSDGAGHVKSGFTDTFLLGNCVQANCLNTGIPGAQVSSSFTGTYTISSSKNGRVQIARTFPASVQPPFHEGLLLYLTGNGNPALILDNGDSTTQNYPSLGVGIAYPQGAGPFGLAGTYGFSLTQQNGGEIDSVAQFAGDPNTSSLSGIMDSAGSPNIPIAGTFGTPGPDGRFTASLGGQFEFVSPITSDFAAEFYAIDSAHGFFVETDLTDPLNPSLTVSMGYYAARTPLCAGCP